MEKLKRWLTNPKVLLGVAILLVLLNFADAGISYWAIYIAKFAYEANPVMAALMSVSPYLFLAFKAIVPTLCAWFLYKHRKARFRGIQIVPWMLIITTLLYVGLLVHFGFLIHTAISAGVL